MLGIYTMAFKISNYPFSKVQGILGGMLFPAFSMISGDSDKMKDNYQRLSSFGGLALIPVLIAIFFGIEHFVDLALGHKWSSSVTIVKILIIYLIVSTVSFADDPLMITLKKIKFLNTVKTCSAIALLAAGFIATSAYGATGMAIAFTVVSLCYTLIIKFVLLRHLSMSFLNYISVLKKPILLAVLFSIIMLVYSILIKMISGSSLVFLAGEGLIFMLYMLVMLNSIGLIDIRKRRLNLDAI
jgi:lipopolysaccharide exporter